MVLEPVHPDDVPVTEYVVVPEGETVMEAVVAPFDQRYVVAPDAVSVADDPAQILPGDEIETVGEGL